MLMNLKFLEFESDILKDNILKDPYIRKTAIIEPDQPEGKPLLIYLSGFLSSSLAQLNYDPLSEDLYSRVKRLKNEGKIEGSIIILPDTFTKVGGNQYLNSEAVGKYEDFILDEIIPYFSEKYSTDKIGVFGKSSGGYGSLTLGMKSKKIKALASHSGDAYFEYVYLPSFPKVIPYLRKFKTPKEWLDYYWTKQNKKKKEDINTLNIVGMAAFYSPSTSGDILLPFDLETGEIINEIWKKWLEKDPVRMIDSMAENLQSKFIYIDVGVKDEFNIQYGSRIIHKKLKQKNIQHIYEEFEDGHLNVSYRYDISIPILEDYLKNI